VLSITTGPMSGEASVELIRAWEKPIKVGMCVLYVVVLSSAFGLWLMR